jgi:hypothetical protein
MKFETIDYQPKGENPAHYRVALQAFLDKKNGVPDSMKTNFVEVPSYGNYPYIRVNSHNKYAVEYLDSLYSDMIENKDCSRQILIEIDESEIVNYSLFTIAPEPLEYGRYTFGNTRIPDCGGYFPGSPSQNCRVGETLLSPVKVKKGKAAKLDLAELHYGGKDKVLLVSSCLKRIFDVEGVTGLDYEPAGFLNSAKNVKYHKSDGISYITYKEVIDKDPPTIEPPYLARISQAVNSEADEITVQKCDCYVHNVVHLKNVVNLKVVPANVLTEDFFQVQGISVKGQIYLYSFNEFYITRKVLELLLRYTATRGFFDMGPFLKTKFAPIL